MGLLYFVFALAALIITQTYAGDRIGDDFVQDLITNFNEVKDNIQDEVQKIQDSFKSNLDKSRTILTSVVDNHISDATKKMENMNCAHGTETSLRETRLQVSFNFLACINFTNSIADLQRLGYDVIQFSEYIEGLAVEIVRDIEGCYNETFFEAAKCVVSTLESQSGKYTYISQQVIGYLDRAEKVSDNLVLEFKNCLGLSQTFARNKISNILKANCETTEINRLSQIKGTI